MNMFEFLFILQFIAVIGITLVKVYNLFMEGQYYTQRGAWLFFIGFMFAWLTGLLITLTDYTTALYGIMLQLESWLILPQAIFLLIELFYDWKDKALRPMRSISGMDRKVDFSRGLK